MGSLEGDRTVGLFQLESHKAGCDVLPENKNKNKITRKAGLTLKPVNKTCRIMGRQICLPSRHQTSVTFHRCPKLSGVICTPTTACTVQNAPVFMEAVERMVRRKKYGFNKKKKSYLRRRGARGVSLCELLQRGPHLFFKSWTIFLCLIISSGGLCRQLLCRKVNVRAFFQRE